MRLSLRAGERVYINGAVLRVDRKVSVELLNDATFLLETHVLQAEAATTPLRQLYFAAQTILIDPANAPRARDLFRTLQKGILSAVAEPELHDGLINAGNLVETDRLIEALKLIRGLYRTEAALLAPPASDALSAPAAVARAPRRARPESRTRPA